MSMASPSTSAPQSLAGKVAIVTGASRGIGEGLAFELAKRGAKVAITYTSDRSTAKTEDLISKIKDLGNGADAIAVQADLRQIESPERIIEKTLAAFGPNVDVLINNAGVELNKPMKDTTVEEFASVYDLNVRGTFLMTKAVVPHLRAPGRIINISSVGARSGFANFGAYCSSKAAVEGYTRCWAAELGPDGHTVNAVNPGPVESEMLDNIPEEIKGMQKKNTPVQNRFGTVDDIAQIVGFLAEEGSRWASSTTSQRSPHAN